MENKETDLLNRKSHYSVFEYLKKQPALLTAVVSAVVIVVAFVMNLSVYSRTYRYLVYWGFSSDCISVSATNRVYVLVVMFIYALIQMGIQLFLDKTFTVYADYRSLTLCLGQMHKLRRKRMRRSRRRIWNIKIKLFLIKIINKTNKNIYENFNNEIIKITNENRDFYAEEKRIKKEIHNLRVLSIRSLVPSLLLVMLVAYITILILTSFTGLRFGVTFILAGVFVTYILGLIFLLSYFEKIRPIKRKIRKVKNECDKLDAIMLELDEEKKREYPIIEMSTQDPLHWVTNMNLLRMLFYVVFACLFVFLLSTFSAHIDTYNKKEFQITVLDEQEYVIIYRDENTYYMNEAIVNGTNIAIDTTKQRIVNLEDISYEVIEFSEVSKLTSKE